MAVANPLLAFRFGFFACHESVELDLKRYAQWRKFLVGGFRVHVHPEARVLRFAGIEAIIVGDVFLCDGDGTVEDAVAELSAADDWAALDRLSGRFALLLEKGGEFWVANDPFGARTVYYQMSGERAIASHSPILAELFGHGVCTDARNFVRYPEYKQRGTSYLPGDATMYSDIKALIPNNAYAFKAGVCSRYWPRSNRQPGQLSSFLDSCDRYFDRFSAHLRDGFRPLLGLTGGVDTRAVIAGLKAKGAGLRLVTWTGTRLPEAEVPVVKNMVAHLGLEHHYVDPKSASSHPGAPSVKQATDAATGFCRGPSVLSASMLPLAIENGVFVRGYGGEILRGFYNRHGSQVGSDLLQSLYELYRTKRVKDTEADFVGFAKRSIEGYLDRANYSGLAGSGYDIRDIYYWEQRMGVWGANMHNEMDPVMYSMTGFNSRPLYAEAFGLEDSERLGQSLMLAITAMYDKTFADIGAHS